MIAVCFDLDGTLYDDRTYVEAGFRSASSYLSAEYGIETFGDMVWEYAIERNFEAVFDCIIDTYELPDTELNNLITAYHNSSPELQPYPETKTMLANLPDNCPTAVITGGKHGKKKLQQLGLGDTFDEVYVTPDNGTSKRDATPFNAVLNTLEVAPERAVFVGDNPELDFYWPNSLGMSTVWVRRPETFFQSPDSTDVRPEYVFPDLSLVPAVVDSI